MPYLSLIYEKISNVTEFFQSVYDGHELDVRKILSQGEGIFAHFLEEKNY